jgi:hypothetical protein
MNTMIVDSSASFHYPGKPNAEYAFIGRTASDVEEREQIICYGHLVGRPADGMATVTPRSPSLLVPRPASAPESYRPAATKNET